MRLHNNSELTGFIIAVLGLGYALIIRKKKGKD